MTSKVYRYGKGFLVFSDRIPFGVTEDVTIIEESNGLRKGHTSNALLVIWSGEIKDSFSCALGQQVSSGDRLEAYFFGPCYSWEGWQKEGEFSRQVEVFAPKELLIYVPKRGEFYHIKKEKFQLADLNKYKEKYGIAIDEEDFYKYVRRREE